VPEFSSAADFPPVERTSVALRERLHLATKLRREEPAPSVRVDVPEVVAGRLLIHACAWPAERA
jgi:hypothetical protein